VRVPLPFSRNQPENNSHNLGKALGERLGLLCAPFTLYPFHLSIPFSSLSPSLSLLSIILLGVSNGRFRPCYNTEPRAVNATVNGE
jgi:hypothetical protein